jgi:hypothetical protein
MQELLQEINAQPTHRIRYRMQIARVRGEALMGWRARSAQTRASANLHSLVSRTARQVPVATTRVDREGQTFWLN